MNVDQMCEHKRTVIWEPHLAGARKCIDCEMVYNPNYTSPWFYEPPSIEEQLAAERARSAELADALERLDAWQGQQSCNASVYEISDDEFMVMQHIIHKALEKKYRESGI